MRRSTSVLGFAMVLWLVAPLAFAQPRDDALLAGAPARPAIGAWAGGVSWNDPVVTYAWSIYPDGTFTSGRFGRGQDGGGVWSANGERLTLKYQDGFRYEGELQQDTYSGNANDASGRRFGAFSMHRVTKSPASSYEAP
ncbi:MAG: hypothetical protein M0D54_20975 [Hyphomonadaceae bacterium JAD_PAG50586_4]|nr:MAG: hypothetical protein M0D54_20975 [Hyphomonadaceae bacterium JAD_PAG50586_4]